MSAAPPLRFLGAVVIGWISLRIVILAPGAWSWGYAPPGPAGREPPSPDTAAAAIRHAGGLIPARGGNPAVLLRATHFAGAAGDGPPASWPGTALRAQSIAIPRMDPTPRHAIATGAERQAPAIAHPGPGPAALRPLVPAESGRWSGAFWLLARRDGPEGALAPGGTLGGSQAGARLLYRLSESRAGTLSLSARAYLPLRRPRGAEAAAGVDWRPLRLPLHLLAERRQRLGRDGRSAFALTAYGGGSVALPLKTRLDAYAQAGVVGLRRRDLFVDGAARIVRRAGPVEIGGGVWGAAQPGVARVDIGPSLALPLRVRAITLRLGADWRFRVAGHAAPDSGPTLTLGADF